MLRLAAMHHEGHVQPRVHLNTPVNTSMRYNRPALSKSSVAELAPKVFKRGFFSIVPEYMSGVRLTLGKSKTDLAGNIVPLKPGIRLDIPIIHDMYKVDMRLIPLEMKPQEVVTSNQVTLTIDTVVWFQVEDAVKAVMKNQNIKASVIDLAQGAVAEVIGHSTSTAIINERNKFNEDILDHIGNKSKLKLEGVKIIRVNMRDVKFPESIVRAMAKKAETDVAGEAKVLHAQYEEKAAAALVKAGELLGKSPSAMDLRKLQTYYEMSKEKGTNTLLIPTEVLNAFRKTT